MHSHIHHRCEFLVLFTFTHHQEKCNVSSWYYSRSHIIKKNAVSALVSIEFKAKLYSYSIKTILCTYECMSWYKRQTKTWYLFTVSSLNVIILLQQFYATSLSFLWTSQSQHVNFMFPSFASVLHHRAHESPCKHSSVISFYPFAFHVSRAAISITRMMQISPVQTYLAQLHPHLKSKLLLRFQLTIWTSIFLEKTRIRQSSIAIL